MYSRKLLLGIFASILLLPSATFAQANVQSGGSLQSPSSNTQNTSTLQTPTTPTQGGSSTFLESQPNSLGVVGNPSQQTPSVVVGKSTSKTDVSDGTNKKSGAWSTILILIALGFVFWLIYRRVSKAQPAIKPTEPAPIAPEKIEPKSQTKKPKKKSLPAQRKKKKKRTHR